MEAEDKIRLKRNRNYLKENLNVKDRKVLDSLFEVSDTSCLQMKVEQSQQ